MRRLFLAVALSLSFVQPTAAGVKVAVAHRLKNPRGGYCTWCALETLGRHLGITDLEGIVDWYSQYPSAGAGAHEVQTQLDEFGLSGEMRQPGNDRDLDFIRNATAAGVPVVVSIRGWPTADSAHSILVTGIDDDSVTYIDSNWPEYDCSVSLHWFQWYWDGWAVTVEPTPATGPEKDSP